MIKITQIKIECGRGEGALEHKIRSLLRLQPKEKFSSRILKHSVDARKKPLLFDIYTVAVGLPAQREKQILSANKKQNISAWESKPYVFAQGGENRMQVRPVVIGAGPAGLFCAYFLAEAGYSPILLERGEAMEQRTKDVESFFAGSPLQTSSNVQFGEGGAGTFSDGKLNTLVGDKAGRGSAVLQLFTQCGAPEEILYEGKPHIGTDNLRQVIVNLRHKIQEAGGEIRFRSQCMELLQDDGHIQGVVVRERAEAGDGAKSRTYTLPAQVVVLAPGHSARDTFEELYREKIPMTQKDFAIGFRVSHPQQLINESQYGIGEEKVLERMGLPAASYKLTARANSGRGVYSFCMCPGGYVVNASSEVGRLAVNGMSNYDRGSSRANSAIVMTVSAEDYSSYLQQPLLHNADQDYPLAGMVFQRELEQRAFDLAQGKVPVESYRDFAVRGLDTKAGDNACKVDGGRNTFEQDPCIRGSWTYAPLHTLLPAQLTRDFVEGMEHFDRQIKGFAGESAYVIGLESRTSSPVRITRGEDCQSLVQGLYPCGEGAGYAGGIMSAAMDGIKVAEAIHQAYGRLQPDTNG